MTADLQNWSVLATRAMNDAVHVVASIESEDTTEELMLGNLHSELRELVMQGFVLNGVFTQRQLDEKYPFVPFENVAL